jgi:hypothetical protein
MEYNRATTRGDIQMRKLIEVAELAKIFAEFMMLGAGPRF